MKRTTIIGGGNSTHNPLYIIISNPDETTHPFHHLPSATSPLTTMNPPTHLVVVCCHGIWTGGRTRGAAESEWLIAPFQAGETSTFMEHIKAGLVLLAGDPNALLMFSGYGTHGCTSYKKGPRLT